MKHYLVLALLLSAPVAASDITLDLATGPYVGIGARDESVGWHLKATEEFLIAGFSKGIQTDYGLFQIGGGPAVREYEFSAEANAFDEYPAKSDTSLGLALFAEYSYSWFFTSLSAIYSEHEVTRKRISGFTETTTTVCLPTCETITYDVPSFETQDDDYSEVDWFLNVGFRIQF